MTKGVKVCLTVVVVIFIVSVSASIFIMLLSEKSNSKKASEENYAEIVQGNEILYRINLSKEPDRKFRVEYSGGGWNEITIENSQIFISDADCSDKTCIKTGKLRSEYVPIVCLPHKLVIRFGEQDE